MAMAGEGRPRQEAPPPPPSCCQGHCCVDNQTGPSCIHSLMPNVLQPNTQGHLLRAPHRPPTGREHTHNLWIHATHIYSNTYLYIHMHASTAHIYTPIHASHTYTHIQQSTCTHSPHIQHIPTNTHIHHKHTCNPTCACICAESLQSCLTLCNLMDCSPPGSSVHVDSPGKNTGVDCHTLLQGIFPNPGIDPPSLSLQVNSLHLSHRASPILRVHMTYTHNTYPNTHIQYIPRYMHTTFHTHLQHTCTHTTHTYTYKTGTPVYNTHVYDTSMQTQKANDRGNGAKH